MRRSSASSSRRVMRSRNDVAATSAACFSWSNAVSTRSVDKRCVEVGTPALAPRAAHALRIKVAQRGVEPLDPGRRFALELVHVRLGLTNVLPSNRSPLISIDARAMSTSLLRYCSKHSPSSSSACSPVGDPSRSSGWEGRSTAGGCVFGGYCRTSGSRHPGRAGAAAAYRRWPARSTGRRAPLPREISHLDARAEGGRIRIRSYGRGHPARSALSRSPRIFACPTPLSSARASPAIAVIGAGIVGAAAAYVLCKRGAHVTLIDRGDPGRGCSYGNAGALSPGSVAPLGMPGAAAAHAAHDARPRRPAAHSARATCRVRCRGSRASSPRRGPTASRRSPRAWPRSMRTRSRTTSRSRRRSVRRTSSSGAAICTSIPIAASLAEGCGVVDAAAALRRARRAAGPLRHRRARAAHRAVATSSACTFPTMRWWSTRSATFSRSCARSSSAAAGSCATRSGRSSRTSRAAGRCTRTKGRQNADHVIVAAGMHSTSAARAARRAPAARVAARISRHVRRRRGADRRASSCSAIARRSSRRWKAASASRAPWNSAALAVRRIRAARPCWRGSRARRSSTCRLRPRSTGWVIGPARPTRCRWSGRWRPATVCGLRPGTAISGLTGAANTALALADAIIEGVVPRTDEKRVRGVID